MREYKRVIKIYEDNEISKCICDKCGKECVKEKVEDYTVDKRTLITIYPQYTGDNSIALDLCPECTRELLNWFPKNDEVEDFKETLDMWEED
jgi:hypothetical protein